MRSSCFFAILTLATLANCVTADNATCNPLFGVFIGDPAFRINTTVAKDVVYNKSPLTLTPSEDKFRCGNVHSSCCSEPIMDYLQDELAMTWDWMFGTIGDMRNMTFVLDGQSSQITTQLDDGLKKISDAYNQMPNSPEKEELKAVLTLLEDLATTGVKVKFAKNTCDVIEHDCGGIWDKAEKYMERVRGHVIAALTAVKMDTTNVPFIAMEAEICDDQPCRQYVCESMLTGFLFTPPTDRAAIATVYVAVALARFGEAFWSALASGNKRRQAQLPYAVQLGLEHISQSSLEALKLLSGLNPLGHVIESSQRRRTSGVLFTAVYDSDNTGL
ncbi:hypothetical protein SARC_08378 [Sphaeroforma arctica JP610]|uniref:Uncharacterized protein n=1 Tax=Sphaeroforma arctica JP610 TaxID=667725 RepID=A0A0L0FR98_9EUKA|nr:hypothetical protein SARC_08378 [Sphaeroforma arctica JP610]KNC79209.1 hypothetical protein SARC_08378 [Sphaeroforma arctica JP610]|eukprot:XP_014153111.1 hypothetical protein SARC_08378 [Sphaeroforma arctica JP610]